MITKELERVGIPTAQITTMTPIAMMVGSNRVVPGGGIVHPVGNAELDLPEEVGGDAAGRDLGPGVAAVRGAVDAAAPRAEVSAGREHGVGARLVDSQVHPHDDRELPGPARPGIGRLVDALGGRGPDGAGIAAMRLPLPDRPACVVRPGRTTPRLPQSVRSRLW